MSYAKRHDTIVHVLADHFRKQCAREAAKALAEAGRLMVLSSIDDVYALIRSSSRACPIQLTEKLIVWATEEQKDAFIIMTFNGSNWSECRGYLDEVQQAFLRSE